jgi:hypothetical protein
MSTKQAVNLLDADDDRVRINDLLHVADAVDEDAVLLPRAVRAVLGEYARTSLLEQRIVIKARFHAHRDNVHSHSGGPHRITRQCFSKIAISASV